MKSFVYFFLVLLVYITNDIVSSCINPDLNYGDMTGDKTILAGSSVEFNCSLHSLRVTVGGIEYDVDSSMLRLKTEGNRLIPEKSVRILDDKTVQIALTNVDHRDAGHFYCFLDLPRRNLTVVCITSLTVGYVPRPIEESKFKCISLHYKSLECSWETMDYHIPTNYSLTEYKYYQYGNRTDLPTHCPTPKSQKKSCLWTLESEPTYRMQGKLLTFELLQENMFGNYTQIFPVFHYSIVKPSKPLDFALENVGSSKIRLTWETPDIIRYDHEITRRITYQLQYVKYNPNDYLYKNPSVNFTSIDVGNVLSYEIEDLIPNTVYFIKLRCKTLEAEREELWSEFVTLRTSTLPDVPYLYPEFVPDSYQIIKHSNTQRSITIYWLPVASEHYNAKGFHYVIEYVPTIQSRGKRSSLDVTVKISNPEATYHTFNSMEMSKAYRFNIFASNNKGRSRNYSTTTVGKNSNLPTKPNEVSVLSYGEGRYEISWKKAPEDEGRIIGYSVFWCRSIKQRPYPCKEKLNMVNVTASKMTTALNLLDPETNYQFAVAAVDEYSASGLVWASCVVSYDLKTVEKVNDIRVEVIDAYSVNVHWGLECEAQQYLVDKFEITYCKEDASDSCQTPKILEIEGGKSEAAMLTDLEPLTRYKITIRIVTDIGPSDESSPVHVTTHPGPFLLPIRLDILNISSSGFSAQWFITQKTGRLVDMFHLLFGREYKTFERSSACFDLSNDTMKCTGKVDELRSYSNYSTSIRACLDSSCSLPSGNQTIVTGIAKPSKMTKPYIDTINGSHVKMSWKRPEQPNGPIDLYILTLNWDGNGSMTYDVLANQTAEVFPFDCTIADGEGHGVLSPKNYKVSIQSGNRQYSTGQILESEPSEYSSVNVCLFRDGLHAGTLLGLLVGVAITCVVIVYMTYRLYSYTKRKIDAVKVIDFDLPDGLKHGKPMSEYIGEPKFKSPLYESNINVAVIGTKDRSDSCDENDEGIFDNTRHGSGKSQGSTGSTDILLYSRTTSEGIYKEFPNQSTNENGHESVSSTSTRGTHISTDSGAYIDSPPLLDLMSNPIRDKVIIKPSLSKVEELVNNSDSSEYMEPILYDSDINLTFNEPLERFNSYDETSDEDLLEIKHRSSSLSDSTGSTDNKPSNPVTRSKNGYVSHDIITRYVDPAKDFESNADNLSEPIKNNFVKNGNGYVSFSKGSQAVEV